MKFKQSFLFVLTLCLLLSSTGFSLPVSPALPPEEPLIPLAPPAASLVILNKSSLSLSIGEGALLVATSNYNISWTSSNTAVATVNNGYVVGHSAGTATITVAISDFVTEEGLTSDTCTVTVGSTPIFENGTYFIENMATGKYVDLENSSTANGATIQQQSLSGDNARKWNVVMLVNGYYCIQSYLSHKFMAIATDSTTAIKQYSSVNTDNSMWTFMKTERGSYALIAKSSESTLKALATPSTTSGDGVNLTQSVYSNNTLLNDEWTLTRMLPLSGYELEYGTGNWTISYIKDSANCYAYAINNQVQPWDNVLWFMQQPGQFSHTSIVGFEDNFSLIENALYQDYADYNVENNTNLVAIPIGKYEPCPVGTYKIALVIDSDTSSTDLYSDYHWYRQDSDGLWSHKRGTTPVTRYDASSIEAPAGELIIDPEMANRNYGAVWHEGRYYGIANYDDFVGYYAVSPWGHLYNTNQPTSITSSLLIQTNIPLAPSSFDNIEKGMTIREVEEVLGSLGFLFGSGVPIAQYSCSDGSIITIRYEHNQNSELIVSQVLKGALS